MADEITYEELHKRYLYISEAGILVNRKNNCIVGNLNIHGYLQTRINNKTYAIHRLIYCMQHGYFPENEIDHINRIRTDNRIENLREVSHSVNQRNCNTTKSRTGVKGVNWVYSDNCWRVTIGVNKKKINVGTFRFFINAVKARLYAENIFNYTQYIDESSAAKFLKEVKLVGSIEEKENTEKVFSEWRFFCMERKKVIDELANS